MGPELARLRDGVVKFAASKKATITLQDLYQRFACESETERERVRRVTSELCNAGRLKKVMSGVYRAKKNGAHVAPVPASLPPLDEWLLDLIGTSGGEAEYKVLMQRAGKAGHKVKDVPNALRKLVAEERLVSPRRGLYAVPKKVSVSPAPKPAAPSSAKKVSAKASETLSTWIVRFLRESGRPVRRSALSEAAVKRGNTAAAINSELRCLKGLGDIVSPARGLYAVPELAEEKAEKPKSSKAPASPTAKKPTSAKRGGGGGGNRRKLAKRLEKAREKLGQARAKKEEYAKKLAEAESDEASLMESCRELEALMRKAEELEREIAAALSG